MLFRSLGVMVPTEEIIARAKAEKANIIGLSGLITPSLDRMVEVASEMARAGLDLPLLIGGATTSAKHTALRIAPAYDRGVVYVEDASKAVGVVSKLMSAERRPQFLAEVTAGRQKFFEGGGIARERPTTPIAEARANAFRPDWAGEVPARPVKTGMTVFDNPRWRRLRSISTGRPSSALGR